MSEKSKIMDADHTSKKGKSTMSKKDLKISLVAKRLSMLQDDRQTDLVVPQEDRLPCQSIKPSEDIRDDRLTDDIVIFKSSQNQLNYGSHKRARVISDDESLEDGKAIAYIQPRNRGRPKKVKSSGLSNNVDVKASDGPKRKKIQEKDLSDPLSADVNKSSSMKPAKEVQASDVPKREKIQRMDLIDPLSAGGNKSSMKRAEEVQANLSDEYPSFVKLMSKSHVSGGFWLGMPKKFCDDHLPISDCIVVLVDEAGKKFKTNYLVAKSGLSGGWRGFSVDHDLREGDVVIYIIREQSYGEVDGALGLLTLDSGLEQQKSEEHTQKALHTEDNYPYTDNLSQSSSDVDLTHDILDGIHFSDSDIKFEAIESFENFNIIADGLVIDSKFPESTRKKYFDLCHSQGSFLHEHLLKGLNCNLVVGIISETVNISDAIKSCKKALISHEDLQIWEKTLKGFELLGMKVSFLCAQINKLQDFEFKRADESNRLKESIIKRAFAGERVKEIENKLTLLKETMEKIDLAMEAEITMASAWKPEAKIKEIFSV
ncbi:hypothetical protein RDABS01_034889 [Bienertia sinuspersici]